MRRFISKLVAVFVLIFVFQTITFALPVVGRIDDFQNATTMDWGGSQETTPLPVHVADGGPSGTGDGYLEISTGGFHLATHNDARQWIGDYLAAGVKSISMDLNHLIGTTDVQIRMLFFGPGGAFATIDRTPIVPFGIWTNYSFELTADELVYVSGGTGILEDTLRDVEKILIRHDSATPAPPGSHPPHITATLGIDNITAVLRPYDVAWIFDNNSVNSYVLDSIDPASADIAPVDSEDPTIFLELGNRYQVTVINFNSHPFEVIAKGATDANDVVLLSAKTGIVGSMETDENVAWEDDGAGTALFTLTETLYTAMLGTVDQRPGYRCGVHVSNMRGDFDICIKHPLGDLDNNCVVDLLDWSLFAQTWLADNIVP